MSTRAVHYLKQRNVPFELVTYRHDQKGALFAASAIGFPLAHTVKTLVVHADGDRFLLALMPGDRQLSLKRLAKALCLKKAAMADTDTAERVTGYLVGGISPFGVKRKMSALMDRSLTTAERVAINAGARGKMLLMAPSDIVRVLDCGVAELVDPADGA